MIETLTAVMVLILVGTEAYCIAWLQQYIKARSEKRSEERRELGRIKAYEAVRERRTIKENRQELWRQIEKNL